MKKICMLTMAAFLVTGAAFAYDGGGGKKKSTKKSCCKKGGCGKNEKSKTAGI